ncbi:hypothetical protein KQI63_05870 [bacterium]|nr:hypothetical protein [bacterium]
MPAAQAKGGKKPAAKKATPKKAAPAKQAQKPANNEGTVQGSDIRAATFNEFHAVLEEVAKLHNPSETDLTPFVERLRNLDMSVELILYNAAEVKTTLDNVTNLNNSLLEAKKKLEVHVEHLSEMAAKTIPDEGQNDAIQQAAAPLPAGTIDPDIYKVTDLTSAETAAKTAVEMQNAINTQQLDKDTVKGMETAIKQMTDQLGIWITERGGAMHFQDGTNRFEGFTIDLAITKGQTLNERKAKVLNIRIDNSKLQNAS